MSKQKLLEWYQKYEIHCAVAFFLGGFIFDILTLADIDDPIAIGQQLFYFGLIGSILYGDFLADSGAWFPPREGWKAKVWEYRSLILHFFLGSLLSVYSLFFLMSASIFSSIVFAGALLVLLVANELKPVQESGVDIKTVIYTVCVFCFFSLLIPTLLGFVGRVPFAMALLLTVGFVYAVYRLLAKRTGNKHLALHKFVMPSGFALGTFVVFYLFGWIPPVPLSAQKIGIYHKVEKADGFYQLYHERPWWKFWQSGDQHFRAAPGDKLHVFVSVFSPGRFDDSVILEWSYKDPRQGWMPSDKIPMRVTGGRKGGYRGVTNKSNFTEGDWRVSVQTTDGAELSRLHFSVEKLSEVPTDRVFQVESY